MNDQPRRWPSAVLVTVATLLAGLGFIITMLVISNDALPLPVDTAVFDGVNDWKSSASWLVSLCALIGKLTEPMGSSIVAVLVVVAFLIARQWRTAAFLATAAVAGVVVSELVKKAVGRSRPPGAEEYVSDLDKSFPSGHSMVGIYVYLAIGVVVILYALATGYGWLRVLGWCLVVFGALLGVTRLILGVHWFSDVLAGWALGSMVLLYSAAIWRPDDAILKRDGSAVGPDSAGAQEPR